MSADAREAVLLLGGRSAIGLAVVTALLHRARDEGRTPTVVLAQRPGGEVAREALVAAGAGAVEVVALDAERLESHEQVVTSVFAAHRVTHAVLAFGLLGDQEQAWQQVDAAQRLVQVNATAAIGCGVAVAAAMRAQAGDEQGLRGTIVAISSVAATRVRRANFVYGASKQAMDSFFLRLAGAVRDEGVRVLVVRPGAVASPMISGREPVPLTVQPEQVARATMAALAQPGRVVVHVPRVFGPAMALARLVPEALWSRLRS